MPFVYCVLQIRSTTTPTWPIIEAYPRDEAPGPTQLGDPTTYDKVYIMATSWPVECTYGDKFHVRFRFNKDERRQVWWTWYSGFDEAEKGMKEVLVREQKRAHEKGEEYEWEVRGEDKERRIVGGAVVKGTRGD